MKSFNIFTISKPFEEEEALYKKEGIPFEHVKFPSNEIVLSLFEKKISGCLLF